MEPPEDGSENSLPETQTPSPDPQFADQEDESSDDDASRPPNQPMHEDYRPGTSVWLLTSERIHWKVTFDYTAFGTDAMLAGTILDQTWFTRADPTPRAGLIPFLDQFDTLRSRWAYNYEPITEHVIIWAAEYQKALLRREKKGWFGPDEDILILFSLRCLVLCNELWHMHDHLPIWRSLTASCPDLWLDGDFDSKTPPWLITKARLGSIPSGPANRDGSRPSPPVRPSVEAYRVPEDYEPPPGVRNGFEGLCLLMQASFTVFERLVVRDRPRDYPALFYALCALMLTHGELESVARSADVLEGPLAYFDMRLMQVVRLFLHRAGKFHPLRRGLDWEMFGEMVGGDELVVEHYKRINSVWVEETERDEELVVTNARSLYKCIDSLVHGFQ